MNWPYALYNQEHFILFYFLPYFKIIYLFILLWWNIYEMHYGWQIIVKKYID